MMSDFHVAIIASSVIVLLKSIGIYYFYQHFVLHPKYLKQVAEL